MDIKIYDDALARKFVIFCHEMGLTDNGIAGLAGNIISESGFSSRNLQNSYEARWADYGITEDRYIEMVDAGIWVTPDDTHAPFELDRAGFGLCQWTSSGRKLGLLNLKKALDVSIADSDMQLQYMYQELSGSYRKVLNTLMDPTKSIRDCAVDVLVNFEKPASKNEKSTQDKRTKNAEEFYELYIKGANMATTNNNYPTIAINAGHWKGNTKGVPASMKVIPNTREWELNCRVVDALVEMLSKYNVNILLNYDTTGNNGGAGNQLADRVAMAEKAKAKFYLSIHHNGGINGGTGGGTVVYCYNTSRNVRQATEILNNIKARTGLKGNRSTPINKKGEFYEVWKPTMDSILVECAFMDSATDINYIAKPEWRYQVAEGLLSFLVNEFKLTKKEPEILEIPVKKEEPKPVEPSGFVPYKVRVTTDALNIRKSYTSLSAKVGMIVDKGVYTIVDKHNNWGKLKSGLGWICLDYTKKV